MPHASMRFLSAMAGGGALLRARREGDPPSQMMRRIAAMGLLAVSGCYEGVPAAAGTDVTGSSTGGSGSGDIGGAEADPALDEAFDDDDALDDWEILNPEAAALEVDGGQLHIEPVAGSLWFNGSSGVLVYKLVEGDFIITAPVVARQALEPMLPPEIQFRLGGVMARAPEDGVQNYVFAAVGADGDDISIETKSTRDSASDFDGPVWDESAVADLRICRRGRTFQMLARLGAADPWIEQAEFRRGDLPDVMQVGVMAYANDVVPNLRLSIDSVSFELPGNAADCMQP